MTLPLISSREAWLDFIEGQLSYVSSDCHDRVDRTVVLGETARQLDAFCRSSLEVARSRCEPADLALRQRVDVLASALGESWTLLRRGLVREGLCVMEANELTRRESEWLAAHAEAHLLPALTPVVLEGQNPLPVLADDDRALLIELVPQRNGAPHDVLIRLPASLPRFVGLPDLFARDNRYLVPAEVAVVLASRRLFAGYEVGASGVVRILRTREPGRAAGQPGSARAAGKRLARRSRQRVLRLEVPASLPDRLVRALCRRLEVAPAMVVRSPGFIGLADVAGLLAHRSRQPEAEPRPGRLMREDAFARWARAERVLHHPHDPSVDLVALFRQAAHDPAVVALRVAATHLAARDPLAEALLEAADAGKSVTLLLALDDDGALPAHLRWTRRLQAAGAQVLHGAGARGLQASLALVVRREGDGLATYAALGTGMPRPDRVDLTWLTTDPAVGRDLTRVFHFATGACEPAALDRLVGPGAIRDTLVDHVRQEIRHVREGRAGSIWIRCNALTDRLLVEALAEAAAAGVEVTALVHGACRLRPSAGGPGQPTIRMRLGPLQDHARVYAFGEGWGLPHPRAAVYLAGCDLSARHLDRRVTVMARLTDPGVHERVLSVICGTDLRDTARTWTLLADGRLARAEPVGGEIFDADEAAGRRAATRAAGPRPGQPGPVAESWETALRRRTGSLR